MTESKSIYEMNLHEEISPHRFLTILRVAGGWIYKDFGMSEDAPASPVFIPFHNEFQEKVNHDLEL